MERAVVVTGGSRGVGRGIVLRLAAEGVRDVPGPRDAEPPTERWPARRGQRVEVVVGSAAELSVAERAADRAEAAGPLVGWVNNAAVFRDATLDDPTRVVEVITTNVTLAVVGCSVAVGRFVAAGTRGAIVNVSSHQAQRAVRGALPYATAKAAVEGLTRAAAVDTRVGRSHRVNAVALGGVRTARYEGLLARRPAVESDAIRAQMAALHPLGRVGEVDEVAEVVAWLLSDAAAFVRRRRHPHVDGVPVGSRRRPRKSGDRGAGAAAGSRRRCRRRGRGAHRVVAPRIRRTGPAVPAGRSLGAGGDRALVDAHRAGRPRRTRRILVAEVHGAVKGFAAMGNSRDEDAPATTGSCRRSTCTPR